MHVDYPVFSVIDKLHTQDELYVRKGLEAMDILEALTSTDNGWNLEKNQVCNEKKHPMDNVESVTVYISHYTSFTITCQVIFAN